MKYDLIDMEELFGLAIAAGGANMHADAMVLLRTILERDPGNTNATYLLAAQHAQLGLVDRADAGFRQVLKDSPGLAIARLQYVQLLMGQERLDDAATVIAPLLDLSDEIGSYARALQASSAGRIDEAVRELDHGFSLPQSIAALAIDMRNLRNNLAAMTQVANPGPVVGLDAPAPMFLTGYGRSN